MDDQTLEHIRALCRLMRRAGLGELDTVWRDMRIFLRSERRGAEDAPARPAPASPAPRAAEEGVGAIHSPLLGVFYRAPAPDRPPFVEVGDLVEEGQTVAVVEAMKVINDIVTDVGGRVVEICVENGQLVKEGDVLMRLAAS